MTRRLTSYRRPRQQDNIGTVVVQLSFFQFTTGAPHPLSSTHTTSVTVSVQDFGSFPYFAGQVLGDHILITVWTPHFKLSLYLVSWKAGDVTSVSGPSERFLSILTQEILKAPRAKSRVEVNGKWTAEGSSHQQRLYRNSEGYREQSRDL
jgi:hypothetical protein